jgi:hypothetical protein
MNHGGVGSDSGSGEVMWTVSGEGIGGITCITGSEVVGGF